MLSDDQDRMRRKSLGFDESGSEPSPTRRRSSVGVMRTLAEGEEADESASASNKQNRRDSQSSARVRVDRPDRSRERKSIAEAIEAEELFSSLLQAKRGSSSRLDQMSTDEIKSVLEGLESQPKLTSMTSSRKPSTGKGSSHRPSLSKPDEEA